MNNSKLNTMYEPMSEPMHEPRIAPRPIPIPRNVHMYEKLFSIFSESYSQKGKQFDKEEFNMILNKFFSITSPDTSPDTSSDNSMILSKLEAYRTNFLMEKRRIMASTDAGNYNVVQLQLHGGFEIDRHNEIIFDKQIVPKKFVICFLTSINRYGIYTKNEKCLSSNFNFGSTKHNNQTKEKKMLKNLLCMDKFTKDQNLSNYNNSKLKDTFLRDVQIYLPGQEYPNLILTSYENDNLPTFIKFNNNKNNFNFGFKSSVSEILESYNDIITDVCYIIFTSCRNLYQINNTTQDIYKHELITYSLNLMLSDCNKILQSNMFKSQSKSLFKFTLNNSVFTLPNFIKENLLFYLLYTIETYNSKLSELYNYFNSKSSLNLNKTDPETTNDKKIIEIILSPGTLSRYIDENSSKSYPIFGRNNIYSPFTIFFLIYNLIYNKPLNDESMYEFYKDTIEQFDNNIYKELIKAKSTSDNLFEMLLNFINKLNELLKGTKKQQQQKLNDIQTYYADLYRKKLFGIQSTILFVVGYEENLPQSLSLSKIKNIVYNPLLFFILVYYKFEKSVSTKIKDQVSLSKLEFNVNKRTQKRKYLPRLGRDARAIAREQILVPSNSLEVNSL